MTSVAKKYMLEGASFQSCYIVFSICMDNAFGNLSGDFMRDLS